MLPRVASVARRLALGDEKSGRSKPSFRHQKRSPLLVPLASARRLWPTWPRPDFLAKPSSCCTPRNSASPQLPIQARRRVDWSAVRATPIAALIYRSAYKKHCNAVRRFERAAKFLRQQQIHRVGRFTLPDAALVPFAAIFAEIGDKAEHTTNNDKIVREGRCKEGRKGMDRNGRNDRSSGTPAARRRNLFAAAKPSIRIRLYSVDIHHIFPKACASRKRQSCHAAFYDSVVNKTPSYRSTASSAVPPSS